MAAVLTLLLALSFPAWKSLCQATGFIPRPRPDVQCVGSISQGINPTYNDAGELVRVDVGYATWVNKAVDCVVNYDFHPRSIFGQACDAYSVPCSDPDIDKIFSHHGNLVIPGFHCPVAGFPNNDPNDESCVWWFGLGPDVGACEYIPAPSAPGNLHEE